MRESNAGVLSLAHAVGLGTFTLGVPEHAACLEHVRGEDGEARLNLVICDDDSGVEFDLNAGEALMLANRLTRGANLLLEDTEKCPWRTGRSD